ncbi:MAG: hypothetical protein QM731_23235 [Chitinophagaceae bacterium]
MTVLLNAVITGTGALLCGEVVGLLLFLILFVLGIVFAIPILPLTNVLVRISVQLPYTSPARIVWLGFCLSVVIVLFYMVVIQAAFSQNLFDDGFYCLILSSTLVGMMAAIYIFRRSLKQLYADNEERRRFLESLK